MADNVGYTPGSGTTIAADDIGGVLHQRAKMEFGVDGEAVDVSATNPLPVNDEEMANLLQRLVNRAESPVGFNKSTQRTSVSATIENGTVTTVTTVTTVATVTAVNNLAAVGGVQGQVVAYGQNLSAWNACVRSRIT